MLLLEVFLFSWACLFLVRRLSFVLSYFRAFVLFQARAAMHQRHPTTVSRVEPGKKQQQTRKPESTKGHVAK